jgi:hypothetical protein
MDGPERPRQVPIGGSTEVNIVRGGLGNLGQALAAAGIAPNRKPRAILVGGDPPAAEAPPASDAAEFRHEPRPKGLVQLPEEEVSPSAPRTAA